MAVTIKMISELSGVSRGTVDRVLNGRGHVKPETEALVRKVAAELGYKPNLAGKALAARKKPMRIGVLLTAEGNVFFDELIRGVRIAEEELSEYGVTVKLQSLKGYDVDTQINNMQKMAGSVDALILNPISHPRVADRINELAERGIPVLCVNTDIQNTKHLCYVGADYYNNGQTAAGMMGFVMGDTKRKKLAIFTGSVNILGHTQRVQGFCDVIAAKHPDWEIMEVLETNDDDVVAFKQASELLEKHPDLGGIYIAAAGTYGVCRAVVDAKHRPCVVSSDNIPATREMLEQGIVQATICQQPYTQGYRSVRSMFDYLLAGVKPSDFIVKSEIRILENQMM